MLQKHQTMLGVIMITAALTLSEISYLLYNIYVSLRRRAMVDMVSTKIEQIDALDDGEFKKLLSVQNQHHSGFVGSIKYIISPPAEHPFSILLMLTRLAIVFWTLWVISLLIFVVIYDRIMAPCPIPWAQPKP